jgi:hypothetical protein
VARFIDPVGDVYARLFAIHDHFLPKHPVRRGFDNIWKNAPLFPSCGKRVAGAVGTTITPAAGMAAFFTGLPRTGRPRMR